MIGKELLVLFEHKHKNPYQGWSRNYFKVIVSSKDDIQNTIQKVKIERVEDDCLVGNIVV